MNDDLRKQTGGRHRFLELPEAWQALTGSIIGAAMDIHTALGSGLFININVASLKKGIHRRINERAFPPEIRIPQAFKSNPL